MSVPTPPAAPPIATAPVPVPPAPAAPAPRPSRTVLAVVAVVVVVVVIVLAVLLTGVLTPSKGSGSAATFSSTRGSAQGTANGASGGPWTLVASAGLAARSSFSENTSGAAQLAGASGQGQCNITPASGLSSSITLPSVANVSSGDAGGWLYIFTSASGGTLLVSVIGGASQVVATASGCASTFGSFAPIPASGLIDSTTAAGDAASAGGYAFLQANPQANATYVLIGGVTVLGFSSGPVWTVIYSDCDYSGAGAASAPAFEVLLSADTGSVTLARATTSSCPSSTGATGLAGAISLGAPTEAMAGPNYWLNFSIQASSGGLAWSDLQLSIQSSSLSTVHLPASSSARVESITGSTLALFSWATSSWVSGGSTGVTSSQVLSIETTQSLSGAGDSLLLTGVGSFSGTESTSIP